MRGVSAISGTTWIWVASGSRADHRAISSSSITGNRYSAAMSSAPVVVTGSAATGTNARGTSDGGSTMRANSDNRLEEIGAEVAT
ncbi:Uncharacterised protein [Mycobacteroides abscessus subsp. massiliense]|nr:Uncharacterised protein [Mycobacteroides abscessus subsp. massiliense]